MTNAIHTVICTGSADSSQILISECEKRAIQAFSFPMIEIERCPLSKEIQDALSLLATYDYIIFTSKYGVRSFFELLYEYTQSYDVPTNCTIACVGQKTATVVETYSQRVAYTSTENNGKDFAKELQEICGTHPTNILFPTGNLTQNMIALSMPPHIHIHKIIVYHTNPPQSYDTALLERISKQDYDYLLFTSPSSVRNFRAISASCVEPSTIQAISIGPSTSAQLKRIGCTHIIEAEPYNTDGIMRVLNFKLQK